MAGDGAAPRRSAWWGRILSALLLAAAILFLLRTGRQVGWSVLGDRIAGADPWLLAAVVLVNGARYVAWAARWQIVARPAAAFPLGPALRALMASLYVTTVVPGSRSFGGLVRSQHLGRALGRPMGPLYGTALVDQLGYSIVSMIMGAVFVLGYWGERSGAGGKGLWLTVAGVAMIVGMVVIYRRRESILERIRRRSARLADGVDGTMRAARDLMGRPGAWIVMGAGGFLVYAGNIVGLQIAAASMGTSMSFAVAAGAFSVGSLAGTVVNTPGGVGTTEYAAVEFLGRVAGVPADIALASVLLARGAHYLLSIVLGGVFFLSGRGRGAEPAAGGGAGNLGTAAP